MTISDRNVPIPGTQICRTARLLICAGGAASQRDPGRALRAAAQPRSDVTIARSTALGNDCDEATAQSE